MAAKQGLFIVAAKRTPYGAFGGKLKDLTATDLGTIAAKAAIQQAKISPDKIGSVVFGNVSSTSKDGSYMSRHVGLRSGIPESVPALTVNRLCGSGFQALVSGAHDILVEPDVEVALCGGSENMSMAPYVLRGMRFGTQLGKNYEAEDSLWTTLTDFHIKTPMGITAENLGKKYGITREQCDEFAMRSQTRWNLAKNDGRFDTEIVPIELKTRKGVQTMKSDENPRETTLEQLGKLPPVFGKMGGTLVTAGNASGICDGAGAMILASEKAVEECKLSPLARLVAWQVVGCDPNIMGIGPAPAIKKMLAKVNMKLDDIDLFEVNEAFAAQFLAVQKDLGLDPNKTNVDGGAISLGHPVGASGSRIVAHLICELRQRNARYAIGSACIGGGQGICVLLERT